VSAASAPLPSASPELPHIQVSSDSEGDLLDSSGVTVPSTPTSGLSSTTVGTGSPATSANSDTEHIYSTPLPILLNEGPEVPRGDYIPPEASALSNMTFDQWFTDYCTNPANALSVAHLYSERQYFLLLKIAINNMRVSEANCTGQEQRWLYGKLASTTYRSVVMKYSSSTNQRLPLMGHVLNTVQGTPAISSTVIPHDALRRVVPITQIVAAISLAHVEGTGHRGQDATLHLVNQLFDGITRPLVREFVRRCAICQGKAAKQHKAKLQPIVAPQLFDRLLIDLVDKRRQSDKGFHYIMHVADHHARYHFLRPLRTKQASSVADQLAWILADIGGCRILQSDQGPEFKGEVTALCEQFGIQQVRSSPYTPSTNGLVEKYNHVVKVGIAAWQAEHGTNSWVACLPRLQVQMNTTWTRAIRCTPYELVFGQIHNFVVHPVMPSGQLDHLDGVEWEVDPDAPEAPRQPPSSLSMYRIAPEPPPAPSPPSSPPPSSPPPSSPGRHRHC
jgi:transposase InsO family protein